MLPMCWAVIKLLELIAVPVNEPIKPSYCHPESARAPVGAEVFRPVPPRVIIALDWETKVRERIVARKVEMDFTRPLFLVAQFLPVAIASSFNPSVERQIS